MGLFVLFYLCLVPLFIYNRHREPIKSRVPWLSVLQMTYILCDFAVKITPVQYMPCFLKMTNSTCNLTLWIYPYFIR